MSKFKELQPTPGKTVLTHWNRVLAFLFLVFGISTLDYDSAKWAAATIFVYAIPLGCQFSGNSTVRYLSLWAGAFLVFQTLLTPYIHYHVEYRALRPHINTTHEKNGIVNKITTDEMGFRVYPEIAYNNKQGFRIFALGGSTTEEIYVDDQKTWSHLTQIELSGYFNRKFEVINTGVSGTRVRNHYAKLKRIIPYKPDMILILAGINDWNKQITDSVRIHKMEPYYFKNSLLIKAAKSVDVFILGPLKQKLFSESNHDAKKKKTEKKSEPEKKKKLDSLNRPVKFSWKPGDVAEEFRVYLEKIQETCMEHNLPCVLLTQPSGYQKAASPEYKKSFWMTPPYAGFTLDFDSMIYVADLYNDFIRAFADRHNMPLCDIARDLEPSADIFYDDCHFTRKGSMKVSRLVSPCLINILKNRKSLAG